MEFHFWIIFILSVGGVVFGSIAAYLARLTVEAEKREKSTRAISLFDWSALLFETTIATFIGSCGAIIAYFVLQYSFNFTNIYELMILSSCIGSLTGFCNRSIILLLRDYLPKILRDLIDRKLK